MVVIVGWGVDQVLIFKWGGEAVTVVIVKVGGGGDGDVVVVNNW